MVERASRRADESGETLIELLIALVIMAIAVVAIVGGLVTYVFISDVHRKQATAGADVRDFAESVSTFTSGTGYTSCASTSSYSPVNVGYSTGSSSYIASVVGVQYWTGTAWSSSCGTDIGLQKVTVQVASADTRASEQAVIIVRKPCGTGSSCTT